tara:strand:- start:14 stop:751 length:738 start_codon:yes stop_codon:yes gene_type:complete
MIINGKNFSIFKELKFILYHLGNVNIRLFFKYIKCRIFEIFYLKNNEEKKYIEFIKEKKLKFSKNWFLSNLDIFNIYLNLKPKNILEIGTYEGLVAIWLSEKYLDANIYAVDPLIQDLSTIKERVEKDQVDNLKFNLDTYANARLKFLKMTSDEFFLENKFNFDIIYIDGLHTFDACTKDILNSFKTLNLNGYLLIDDLRLDVYPKKLNIINAVNNFLSSYKNYLDVVFFGWNLMIIKKKKDIKL